jgi:hypothetical protein
MGEIFLKNLVCFKQKATSTDWFLCGFLQKGAGLGPGHNNLNPKPLQF